jgi:hypothetical protein
MLGVICTRVGVVSVWASTMEVTHTDAMSATTAAKEIRAALWSVMPLPPNNVRDYG